MGRSNDRPSPDSPFKRLPLHTGSRLGPLVRKSHTAELILAPRPSGAAGTLSRDYCQTAASTDDFEARRRSGTRCKYAAFGKICITCHTNIGPTLLPSGPASQMAGATLIHLDSRRRLFPVGYIESHDAKQAQVQVTPARSENQARVDCCIGRRPCAWGVCEFVADLVVTAPIFVARYARAGQRAGPQQFGPARAHAGRKEDHRQRDRSLAPRCGDGAVPMAEDLGRAGWPGQLLRHGERQKPIPCL